MSTVVSAADVGGGGTADGSDCSPAMIIVKKGPRDLNARGQPVKNVVGQTPTSLDSHRGVAPLSLEIATSPALLESRSFVMLC